MRWLMMATLATGLCAATAAQSASPLDAPDPLAGPAQAQTGTCSFHGGGNADIARVFDALMTYWQGTFANARQSALWRANPLKLQIEGNTLHLWQNTDVEKPWPWMYNGLVELDSVGKKPFDNLAFVQWTSPKYARLKDDMWFVFDPKYVAKLISEAKADTNVVSSDIAWLVALSHEFGHYVQRVGKRGGFPDTLFPSGPNDATEPHLPPNQNINKELEADRLAGAFFANQTAEPGCVSVAKDVLRRGSDDGKTNITDPHGSSKQRIACFSYGMKHGVHPFFAGDSGTDIVGDAQRKHIQADCADTACKKKPGSPQAQRMQMDESATGDDDGCDATPEPKIGPPVATGGAPPCVSNVFEKGQGCVCPPGMPVREEIGDPAKLGAEHVMVWCRRGKARM